MRRILLAVLSTLLYFTGAHAQPTALTARAPDAFYEPPPGAPRKPGTLLHSEPLKDVILPVGMQGWKILYATKRTNDIDRWLAWKRTRPGSNMKSSKSPQARS